MNVILSLLSLKTDSFSSVKVLFLKSSLREGLLTVLTQGKSNILNLCYIAINLNYITIIIILLLFYAQSYYLAFVNM